MLGKQRFLQDKCKHLMVVLGLSMDYTVTKRCLVVFVRLLVFLWECNELLGIQNRVYET